MIEASIILDGDSELALIRMEKIEEHPDGTADYVIEIGVNRAQGVTNFKRRRVENFPRLKYNVLGLLTLALQTLEPEDLQLEHGTAPSDLAWRQRGARISIPR